MNKYKLKVFFVILKAWFNFTSDSSHVFEGSIYGRLDSHR